MTEADNISEILANAFAPAAETTPAGLELDHARYLPELADLDMPEEQKIVLIETLWPIMRSLVDLGYASEVPANTCGQLSDVFNDAASPTLEGVDYAEVSLPRISASRGQGGKKGWHHDGA